MNHSRTVLSSTLSANLTRASCRGLASSATATIGLRSSYALLKPLAANSSRQFSTSRKQQIEVFPPSKNLPNIKLTPPAWPHPNTTEDQLKSIQVAHREPKTWSDRAAYNMVRILRWGTDLATGYRHDPTKPYVMSPKKWLVRFIFLETVAGVPGMVAGMLRHFHSLRVSPLATFGPLSSRAIADCFSTADETGHGLDRNASRRCIRESSNKLIP